MRSYKRFEADGRTTFENFVRIVSVFQRAAGLALLFPAKPPQANTLDAARRRLELRQLVQALHEAGERSEARRKK